MEEARGKKSHSFFSAKNFLCSLFFLTCANFVFVESPYQKILRIFFLADARFLPSFFYLKKQLIEGSKKKIAHKNYVFLAFDIIPHLFIFKECLLKKRMTGKNLQQLFLIFVQDEKLLSSFGNSFFWHRFLKFILPFFVQI